MERDEQRSELIELGSASVETKGKEGQIPDFQLGLGEGGLTND